MCLVMCLCICMYTYTYTYTYIYIYTHIYIYICYVTPVAGSRQIAAWRGTRRRSGLARLVQ